MRNTSIYLRLVSARRANVSRRGGVSTGRITDVLQDTWNRDFTSSTNRLFVTCLGWLNSAGSENRGAFAATNEFNEPLGAVRSFGSRTNTSSQNDGILELRGQQAEKVYAWDRDDGTGRCNNKVDLP